MPNIIEIEDGDNGYWEWDTFHERLSVPGADPEDDYDSWCSPRTVQTVFQLVDALGEMGYTDTNESIIAQLPSEFQEAWKSRRRRLAKSLPEARKKTGA